MHRWVPAITVAIMLVLAGCTGGGNISSNNAASSGNSLGYAVGGANNINNFRNNVEAGNLLLATDVTTKDCFTTTTSTLAATDGVPNCSVRRTTLP